MIFYRLNLAEPFIYAEICEDLSQAFGNGFPSAEKYAGALFEMSKWIHHCLTYILIYKVDRNIVNN